MPKHIPRNTPHHRNLDYTPRPCNHASHSFLTSSPLPPGLPILLCKYVHIGLNNAGCLSRGGARSPSWEDRPFQGFPLLSCGRAPDNMPCGRHRLQCPGASTLYVSWIFYLRAWAPFPRNTNEGSSGVPPGVSDVSRSKPTFGFHSPQPTFPFPSRWRDSKRGTGKRKPGAFERSLPCAGGKPQLNLQGLEGRLRRSGT